MGFDRAASEPLPSVPSQKSALTKNGKERAKWGERKGGGEWYEQRGEELRVHRREIKAGCD